MSNIRLNTIVPDVVNNASGGIDLPGSLSVMAFSCSSTLDAATPSNASVTLQGGLGVGKSLSIGGNISFSTSGNAVISQNTASGSDNKGIILSGSGGIVNSRGALLELYGNQVNTGNARLSSGSTGNISLAVGATPTDAMVISSTGVVTVYGTTSSTSPSVGSLVLVSGGLSIANATDATSTTSGGAVTIAGGMSVAKSLYIGGAIVSAGAFSNSVGISTTAVTESTGLGTGSLFTLGGAAVSKKLYVGGITSLLSDLSVAGTVTLSSTSTTAVSLSGGMSIAKNLSVTGTFTGTSSASIAGIVSLTNATDSSLPTNGALIVTGGAGISATLRVGGSAFVGSNLTLSSTSSTATFAGTVITTDSSDTTALNSGAFRISSGISVSRTARFGSNVFITGTNNVTGASTLSSVTASGNVSITSATQSTTPTTGAFTVTGGFGLLGDMNSAGIVTLSNTTDSSSVSSGSLILTNGGLGVARSVNIGANLSVAGVSIFTGTLTAGNISHSGTYVNSNATPSTSPTTGSALFAGGVGITGGTYLGAELSVATTSSFTGNAGFAGIITSTNATDATSLTSASIVTSGGVAITKSLRVGTTGTFTGGVSISGILSLLNTTTSSNTTTGAAVISGGVGVGGALNVGGTGAFTGAVTLSSTSNFVGVATFSNVTDATASNLGSIVSLGGIAAAKGVWVGTTLRVVGASNTAAITASGIVTVTNATASSATTNGALVVTGGIGTGGNINCGGSLTLAGTASIGGIVTFTNSTDSLNSTNGAAVFSGGVAVSRNLNVGGAFSVGTNSLLTGTITNTAGIIQLNTVTVSDATSLLSIQSAVPGVRIAPTDATKTTVSTNTIDIFSLGNLYTDANHEALRIGTQSTDSYSIVTRAAGTGVTRRLVLQSGNNSNQLLLDIDGTVELGSVTTDSLSTTGGSVTVSGGLGVQGSVSLGKSLRLFGATSGSVTVNTPATITSYSLTLPATVSPASNYALVSDTAGNLSWSQMTTPNPSFQSVAVTNNTVSSSTGTGALTVGGGLGVVGAEYLGGNLTLTGASGNNMVITNINGVAAPTTTTRSAGTRFILYPNITSTTTDHAIGVESLYTWYTSATSNQGGHKWYSATRNTMTLDFGGNLSLYNGGGVTFTGGTSGTIKLSPPSTITSYTLTMPTALPSANNMALVSTTAGTLTWAEMTTTNPTFQSARITNTTANTGLGTGALIISGGTSIGSGLSLSGNLKLVGATSGVATIAVPATNASPTFTLPADVPNKAGQVLSSDSTGSLSWIDVPVTGNFSASLANNVINPVAILGLKFTGMFKLDIYVRLSTSTATYGAMYTLRGFQAANGWQLYENYVGDNTGVDFTIDSVGQILYTSSNIAGWTGTTASWSGPDVFSTPAGGTPQSAVGANNVPFPANVTGLVFTPPQFSKYVLVTVNNSTIANSTNTLFLLQGTQQQTTAWDMTMNIVSGPDPGIRFSILSTGQVQYVAPNIAGWLSTTFTFYADDIPLQNSASYNNLSIKNNITSPKFQCIQVYNNVVGPYPLSTTFTTAGGTLLFTCSMSAYVTTVNTNCTFTFTIDGVTKHTFSQLMNPINTHFNITATFVAANIASGSHTLGVTVTGGTSDTNDRIDVTMTEYPF